MLSSKEKEKMSINTGIQVFSEVEGKILNYLNETPIPYIYDSKWNMFTCTQIYGDGEECVDNISILLDEITNNYLVEVRRITGDTSPSIHDIYTDLYNLFTQQTSNP